MKERAAAVFVRRGMTLTDGVTTYLLETACRGEPIDYCTVSDARDANDAARNALSQCQWTLSAVRSTMGVGFTMIA